MSHDLRLRKKLKIHHKSEDCKEVTEKAKRVLLVITF